ncbi:MAG: efflux RND transporter periplasmic adaptor subunit [Colwellia sp.]|nr:efflux RND transporter periplasmic adaptor subunit [Colwellia sp.]
MDIVREKPKSLLDKRKFGFLTLVAIASLVVFYFTSSGNGSFRVAKDSLLIDVVQRGELNVSVRGTGILVPQDIRWVATNVEGRVERILTKAGAQVKKGDLLMELSNPQLVQQLEETKWQLEEMIAETNAQEVDLESQLLDQEAAVINERLNHQRALLTFNAQKKLLDQGVVAVSQIDHAEVQIEVAQFKERWQLEIKRLDKKKESLVAQSKAYKAKVHRMRRILQRIQDQVDGLNVKATMDSIVQVMPMELGQQVSAGTNLARLARRGEFFAELRIPEKQIKDVELGQIVTIDTRTSKIQGLVKRIDPAVTNGSVQVDVQLTGDIPKEARPDLTIDGVIEIARISDTLFVKRPMFASGFTDAAVYMLDAEGEYAHKTRVTFGQTSTRYIQIQAGLKVGENIIVSDSSSWQQHQQIRLN